MDKNIIDDLLGRFSSIRQTMEDAVGLFEKLKSQGKYGDKVLLSGLEKIREQTDLIGDLGRKTSFRVSLRQIKLGALVGRK